MGSFFTGLFGGGGKPKVVPAPREDQAAAAQARERQRRLGARGVSDTILNEMSRTGKQKLGQ